MRQFELTDQGGFTLNCLPGLSFSFAPVEGMTAGTAKKAPDGGLLYPLTAPELPEIQCGVHPLSHGLRMTLHADAAAPISEFSYPGELLPLPGDEIVYPYSTGFVFPVEKMLPDFPERLTLMGFGLSMAFWGYLRGDKWLLIAVITNVDAQAQNLRTVDHLQSARVVWLPEKERWGYDREIRFLWGEGGGVTALCHAYRAIADEKGLRVTLREKCRKTPALTQFVGSADMWLWNDDAMHKLYDADAVYHQPTADQYALRLQIAREMKACGMDHVLWSVFDENVDPPTVEAVQSLGYQTTYYDIYTDVIPHDIAHLIPDTRLERCKPRLGCWPDGIRINRDGSRAQAWALKGKDGVFHSQECTCDIVAYDCALHNIPTHSKANGLNGRFIDVILGGASECWDAHHPMTRRTCLQHKLRLLDMVCAENLICGTEEGCEDAVPFFHYNEGLMSPRAYRQYDAGRRMTHIYRADEVTGGVLEYNLSPRYRAPLWQLVYHGCVQSYFYWGDSTGSMPDYIAQRDDLCRLYGEAPLYSFRCADWPRLKEDITASYQRTVPHATRVGWDSMESFEYLDASRLIQRTLFSGGVSVVANFSDDDFCWQGECIPAHTSRIFA